MCALSFNQLAVYTCCFVVVLSRNTWAEVQEHPPPAPRLPATGYSLIPHRIWVSYGGNSVEGNETTTTRFVNMNNSASLYREAWEEQTAPVDFLADQLCAEDIFGAEPQLLEYYQQTTSVLDRTDICRIATLYLHGGYSFDLDDDLEVVEAYKPHNDSVSFVTVTSSAEGAFFRFFIASAPKHPILRHVLSEMVSAYRETGASVMLGATLKKAYFGLSAEVRGQTHLLVEKELGWGDYPDIAKHHAWDQCTSIVHDPTQSKVFFFSSFVQNEHCQPFPTPRLRAKGRFAIPHRIWFTYGSNFVEENETSTHRFVNMNNTASVYKEAWREQSAKVDFLSDEECAKYIVGAEPKLLKYYRQATSGPDRADICRTAALYLHGGYSFDLDDDLEVVEAYVPQNDSLSFVVATSSAEGVFSRYFIACAPNHPILRQALSEMVGAYGETRISWILGPTVLRKAYDALPVNVQGESHLLVEKEIGGGDYPDLAELYGWDHCTSVIHDPTQLRVLFYSSFVQNEHCQPSSGFYRTLRVKTDSPEIPHRIWFTDGPHFKRENFRKGDLRNIRFNTARQGSKRNGAASILDDIERMVQTYDRSWGSTSPRVSFLDKADCAYFIRRVEPALSPYFQGELDEANREDMCRAAVLYLHGGYSFDVRLNALKAFKPAKDGVALVTSVGCDGDCFSRAFLASAPGHPVVRRAMDLMLRIYREGGDTSLLGPRTLRNVFYALPEGMRGDITVLQERLANETDHPRQGVMEECDSVISNGREVVFHRHNSSCDEQIGESKDGEESSGMVIVLANQPKTGTGTVSQSLYRSLSCKDFGHVERPVLRYDCGGGTTMFHTHDVKLAAKSLDDLRHGLSSHYEEHRGDDEKKTFHPEQHVREGRCLVVTSVRDPMGLLPSWFSERNKEVLKGGGLGPAKVEKMYRTFLQGLPRSNIRLYEGTFDLLRAFGATNMTEELQRQDAGGGHSFLERPDPDGPWRGCRLLFLKLEAVDTWAATLAAAIHGPVQQRSTSTLGSHPKPAALIKRVTDPRSFASEIAGVVRAKPIFAEILNYYESSSSSGSHRGRREAQKSENLQGRPKKIGRYV